MDNLVGSVQEIRKTIKKAKAKKTKPMRVVYISNPIKFNISASEFRGLVQQFTGQDSELPHSTGFIVDNIVDCHVGQNPTALNHSSKPILDDDDDDDGEILPLVDFRGKQQQNESSDDGITESAAAFDDIFTPQMFEKFSGLMPSSSKPFLDYDNEDGDDGEILPSVDLRGKQWQQLQTESSDAHIIESAAAFDDIFTHEMFEN